MFACDGDGPHGRFKGDGHSPAEGDWVGSAGGVFGDGDYDLLRVLGFYGFKVISLFLHGTLQKYQETSIKYRVSRIKNEIRSTKSEIRNKLQIANFKVISVNLLTYCENTA